MSSSNRFALARLMKGAAWSFAAVSLFGALPVATASAQTHTILRERDGAASGYYYQLPNVVRVRPGTARILQGRCNSAYPMDESMPCGDVTGGPVGGRGS